MNIRRESGMETLPVYYICDDALNLNSTVAPSIPRRGIEGACDVRNVY
jgi:hypothetical protein